LPFLPTDRLRRERRRPGEGRALPRVMVDKRQGALVLAAVDRAALQLGLRAGMTLADARARTPGLDIAPAEPARDDTFLGTLAAFCDQLTPLVARDEPYGLMLDMTGCAHLFGGEAALRDRLTTRLARLGLFTRVALAGTPDAARAFARFAADPPAAPPDEEEAAKALPVAALEAGPDTTLALTRAGLTTLRALDERPSAGLAARFGSRLVTKLRRVLGREDRRITPLRAPPVCMVERHFPEPFLDERALAGVLERLIAEAGRVLEGRGIGGRVFEASFFRSDGAVRRLTVETGRPLRDAATVMRLFRERLESLVDPLDPGFGFDAIRLAVPLCEAMPERQPDLAGGPVEDDALEDLLDRLGTRLGRDRVLRFAPRDSHQAERAFLAVPATGLAAAHAGPAWPEPEPDEPPARPLQILRPPEPVETLAEVPDGPPSRFRWRRRLHMIAHAEGPERIAPDWWRDGSDAPTRDYYRVEDVAGRRFWLFRQGLYGAGGAPPRWFLHGVFA
jgi:protein ImuB